MRNTGYDGTEIESETRPAVTHMHPSGHDFLLSHTVGFFFSELLVEAQIWHAFGWLFDGRFIFSGGKNNVVVTWFGFHMG